MNISFYTAFLILLLSFPLFADSPSDKSLLTVSQDAQIKAKPDYVNFTIVVEKTKSNKAKAKEAVDQVTAKVLKTLEKQGINKQHFEASEISSSPKYNWTKKERTYEGELVRRTIKIKLYDTKKYTDLVSAVSNLEITSYYQQGFGYDDLNALRNKALVKAIEMAKQKAQLIAQNFDVRIIKPYSINEESSRGPQPLRFMADNARSKSSENAPLEIKEQEISAFITVTFIVE